ncbi:hypothetical protein CTYAZ2_29160 [Comamonas testosteroni]|nr:hypothetical protein CTYAZ2_29160 [Comamonas testosteroni]
MATAPQHADRTASEARRPEAGSRAGGVSRAERGNDGSPTGARRRRWLDAQHDSATGHLPGGRGRPDFKSEWTTGSGRAHARHRGSAADAVWPIRRSRVGGVQGCQACAAGIARRAFPWSASAARSAAGAKVSTPDAAKRKVRRPRRDDAPKAARRDQFAAGAVIDSNWSITPGSTNTQACSSAIGTLNTWANTVRRR